ncbi:MAG: enoyl-CoA hydratase-related protein [Thermodesulfobacteriota bacterium]
MPDQPVSYELENGIAVITIDHPPRNVFTLDLRSRLEEILDELEARKHEVNVLVLTAKGEAFIAGADIKSFLEMTPEKAKSFLKKRRPLFNKLERFDRPTICAINGYCLGAGLEVALCCDLRLASEKAKLGSPEVNVGVIPGAGGTQRLPRLVGVGKAKEIIFTGRMLDAAEALSIGLVNQVTPAEELKDRALALAANLKDKSPLVLRAAKEAIDRGLNMCLAEGLDLEAAHWAWLCGTEDQKEGARAFLEKRKAVYKGN